MTGLEKIVAAICQQAQAEAEATIASATDQAQQIKSDANTASRAFCAQIEADAKAQAEQIERTASSSAALETRRRVLKAKQEILAKTVEQALEALHALPEDQYFDLLVKMAAMNAEPREGELMLCERDKSRCPGDFESRLVASLPAGAKLSVSNQTRPIDGGFILRYGNIELNCSFRAIFDARREELSDGIRGILFP